MTGEEIDDCMASLASLFPSFNDKGDAELAIWRDQLSGQDHDAVKGAILTHKLATKWDRVTFPDVLDRVRETKVRQAPAARQNVPDESFADILRKHNPQWRGSESNYKSDYHVILRYYWGLWQRAKSSVSQLHPKFRQRAEDGYRRQFRDACFNNLVAFGMVELSANGTWDYGYANRCADAIFEPAEFFRMTLAEVDEDAPCTKESPVVDEAVPLPAFRDIPVPPAPTQAIVALAEHELKQREAVTV